MKTRVRLKYSVNDCSFDILKKAHGIAFQASAEKICFLPTILMYKYESISTDVSKNLCVVFCNHWILRKNGASQSSQFL